ncbi:hypothetical protein N7491_001318 [Penicillium cf. griseofulvum]|uniref:Uncharacterized protein n=1 Tax=Penicillium cf. griseofulvum TaxID=2972120 RepID=A0A9W9MBA3_9EURO|nr:hypothetical protein N7472_006453 [Penicillium cf. griseofulvum]KAJ5445236.1 hypothetical protein N7491_001318 [Penicillium cf. griseofulvum]KAJ5446960.1 hypothetical protein N7445_001781 [Penicillium cf. griseofulvum]
MKLEKEYVNKETELNYAGDNMEDVAVKITRDGDGYAFERYKMRECQPSAWPYMSSQDVLAGLR